MNLYLFECLGWITLIVVWLVVILLLISTGIDYVHLYKNRGV